MTEENKILLSRINSYSESVLGQIDPQKVPVSQQLETLKPIMQEIAAERNMKLEDVFILYMDLQTEASCLTQKKFAESLEDINTGDGMPILFK